MDTLATAVNPAKKCRGGCGSHGVIMSAHNALYCSSIKIFGSEEQNLSPFLNKDNNGCFGLTEPGNGAASTTTRYIYL